MHVPASLAAVPLLAGSAAGVLLHDAAAESLWLYSAAAALFSVLAGVAAFADDASWECTAAVMAGFLFAGAALGADAASRASEPPLLRWYHARQTGDPVVLEGVLREDAAVTPFGVSLLLDVDGVHEGGADGSPLRTSGGMRLTVGGELGRPAAADWRGGRRIRVTATPRLPAAYYNPGVPDERRALARRGVVLLGSVKSAALVEIVARGSPASEAAAASRAWARDRLGSAVGTWSARSAAIAAAILIGDRTGLSDEDERRLQKAGTYHVVAISGGNIAILTVLLLGTLRLLRVPDRVAAAASILLLGFYGEIVVAAASVSRAITAATIYLAARLLDQRGPALNILAAAAVAAVALRPLSGFDPAFLLSFGATLGILVGVPRLMPDGRRLPRPVAAVLAVLAATIAAELALAPIAAGLFSRITFAGLLLNFAAIPLMTLVQAGSLAVLALAPVSGEAARLVGGGVHASAFGLVESARLVEVAPWLSMMVTPPAWWASAVYYAGLALVIGSARLRRPAGAVAAGVALSIMAGVPLVARDRVDRAPAGFLRVVFLDVGQADATLLILPDRRALLVDTGGLSFAAPQNGQAAAGYDIGRRVIAPALRALGVRRLDTMVITHGDPDHIGGAPTLLRQFRPRAVWEGIAVPPHEPLRLLARAADAAGAAWRNVQRGDLVRISGLEIHVLHPPPPDWERQRVRNEDSVVLDVRMGDISVVLPGDIGREGEAVASPAYRRARLTVLKAPHHGSATSSTPGFLALTRPDAVVFSAGRGNRFGHPAPAVVARYRSLGSEIFSTAEDGAVILDTDGRTVTIRTWLGRKVVLTGDRRAGP